MRGRHSEDEVAIRTRLHRAEMEMAAKMRYHARVVNSDVETAVNTIHGLIQSKLEARKQNGCRKT